MKTIFALGRILGNELPPRDEPGGRLASLEDLLREPPLPGVVKFWIINRVWDPRLAPAYRQMLAGLARGDCVVEIPFEPGRYFEADGQWERLRYCPGINPARNEGLRIAFDAVGAKFAAVFDGDCGFTPTQWVDVSSEIFADCADGTRRRAYSVPMIRINRLDWCDALRSPVAPVPDSPHEPQLIVSRQAWQEGLRYDESLPFGENDKVDLLVRLGHHPWTDEWHKLLNEDQCRSVGRCYHVNTGPDAVEADICAQWSSRRDALLRLHRDITRHYRMGAD